MKNRKRVVIDTNIFIDGWFRNSESAKSILDMIDNRKFYLAFSQETIGELMNIVKNFARHYMDSKDDQLKLVQNVATLYYYSTSVNTKHTQVEKIRDKNDLMFVKCAKEANADFLISNDFKSGMHEIGDKYGFKIISSEECVTLIDKLENES